MKKYWCKITEYHDYLAPLEHEIIWGREAVRQARRTAQYLSTLSERRVVIEGYRICQTYLNGSRVK